MPDRLINQFGRALDDLDILKLRVSAKQVCASEVHGWTGHYAIESRDGRPIAGFVPDDPGPGLVFTATQWSQAQ